MAKGVAAPFLVAILTLSVVFAAVDIATGRAIQITPGAPPGVGGAGQCPEGEVYIDGRCVGGGNFWVKVTKTGSGDGSVDAVPAGLGGDVIKCGQTCGAVYGPGTVVTLLASPDANSKFAGWTGDCAGSTGNLCYITVNSEKNVGVKFDTTLPSQKLGISITGTGSGTVKTVQGGCAKSCTQSFIKGTEVTLEAVPDAGSTFAGWKQGCAITFGKCWVTMDADKAVVAEFASTLPSYKLALKKEGIGTVESSPAGIKCWADCQSAEYKFLSGQQVTLTAKGARGSIFEGWSGACKGKSATCTVTMNNAKSVTAVFSSIVYLHVSTAGAGKVTSPPVGDPAQAMDCRWACDQAFKRPPVKTVTLTAVPDDGQEFLGWSGDCTGKSPTCTLSMDGWKNANAAFSSPQISSFRVEATKIGASSGKVTSSPAGINCGTDCWELFKENSLVTLTAVPDRGSTFAGWLGDCSGTGPCVITVGKTTYVSAEFVPTPPAQPTVAATYPLTVKVTGKGKVDTLEQPNIACSTGRGICTENYKSKTNLELTATPENSWEFSKWIGCDFVPKDDAKKCYVGMDAPYMVTAVFEPVTAQKLVIAKPLFGTVSYLGKTCPPDCCSNVEKGQQVTLTASPATGSSFSVWNVEKLLSDAAGTYSRDDYSGSCGTALTCAFSVDADRFVIPNFFNAAQGGSGYPGVELKGSDSGVVVSSDGSLLCTARDCKFYVPSKSLVSLFAVPFDGKAFNGWNLCYAEWAKQKGDEHTGPVCTRYLTKTATVTAAFGYGIGDAATSSSMKKLAIAKAGKGTGVVKSYQDTLGCENGQVKISDGRMFDCGTACAKYLRTGAVMTFVATPTGNSAFEKWSGCTYTKKNICVVVMGASDKTVTASFAANVLTVKKSGECGNVIVSADGGINCGSSCSKEYPYETMLTLIPQPSTATEPGSKCFLTGWTGCQDVYGDDARCVVKMDAAKTVTAKFHTQRNLPLNVVKVGRGTVWATSEAGFQIDCGDVCSADYVWEGETVILWAEPYTGSTFTGFVGCDSVYNRGTDHQCTVKMTSARTVTAYFQ